MSSKVYRTGGVLASTISIGGNGTTGKTKKLKLGGGVLYLPGRNGEEVTG